MKKLILIIFVATTMFYVTTSNSAQVDTNKVFGVTIDGINNLNSITTALSSHTYKPTTRIVFDEFVAASNYLSAVNQIHNVSFIMGELLDSYYMNQYTTQQYTDRVNEYYNTLCSKVDIWEIGNEINGEWLGNTTDVVAKMTSAYNIIKSHNAKTAITLYYNYNCWSNPQNEMFRWAIQNIPANMKSVVNENTCIYLASRGWFYIMHRFGIDNLAFTKNMHSLGLFASISVGVNEETYQLYPDYEKVSKTKLH